MRRTAAVVLGGVLCAPFGGPAAGQTVWTVAARPDLVIGALEGASSEMFHDIRGVVEGAGGVVAVADGASLEVRIFSSTGAPMTAFGRRGGGPLEFEGIDWIEPCGGESLVAYDFGRFRITKWDADGRLLDELALDGPTSGLPPYAVSCGPAGSYAVVGWPDIQSYRVTSGPYRPRVTIAVADDRGAVERVIGAFDGPERYRYPSSDGPRFLGKTTTARMGADAVYIGTADRYEIVRIGADGRRHAFGRPSSAIELTPAMVRRWQASVIRSAPLPMRPAIRRSIGDIELPRTLPAYADFQLDRLGYVWVAPYAFAGGPSPAWDVFDPDGALVATVAIPAHFRPTDIARDWILGVTTDTLGVQRAARYRLLRGDRPPAPTAPGGIR